VNLATKKIKKININKARLRDLENSRSLKFYFAPPGLLSSI
jgi:hypothetical protein